jgi:hypothetical protein
VEGGVCYLKQGVVLLPNEVYIRIEVLRDVQPVCGGRACRQRTTARCVRVRVGRWVSGLSVVAPSYRQHAVYSIPWWVGCVGVGLSLGGCSSSRQLSSACCYIASNWCVGSRGGICATKVWCRYRINFRISALRPLDVKQPWVCHRYQCSLSRPNAQRSAETIAACLPHCAGHYVSLIKSKSTWLFFDDDQVDLISESTVAATFGSTQVRETAEWQLQRVIGQRLVCTRWRDESTGTAIFVRTHCRRQQQLA